MQLRVEAYPNVTDETALEDEHKALLWHSDASDGGYNTKYILYCYKCLPNQVLWCSHSNDIFVVCIWIQRFWFLFI